MPEMSALPMAIPSQGFHFFVSQAFRFPESNLKVAPDRSQMPAQTISVLPVTSLGRHAQEGGSLARDLVRRVHWHVPRT